MLELVQSLRGTVRDARSLECLGTSICHFRLITIWRTNWESVRVVMSYLLNKRSQTFCVCQLVARYTTFLHFMYVTIEKFDFLTQGRRQHFVLCRPWTSPGQMLSNACLYRKLTFAYAAWFLLRMSPKCHGLSQLIICWSVLWPQVSLLVDMVKQKQLKQLNISFAFSSEVFFLFFINIYSWKPLQQVLSDCL